MATSSSELLTLVEEAIKAFMTNGAIQSYTIDGTTVTRANLADLIRWRERLRSEVDLESGSAVNYFRRGKT